VRGHGRGVLVGLAVVVGAAGLAASELPTSAASAPGSPISTERSDSAAPIRLPHASLPTASAVVDSRPATCPPPNGDPNTGSGTATQTGEFPWPGAPSGTSELKWLSDPHTPVQAIPERPANWSNGGGNEKLTSARSSVTELSDNPQELCGVEGNSVDAAWEETTGRPSTVIAVTDSGIEWCDPALVDKIFLNRSALPVPENARGETKSQLESAGVGFADSDPYDLNGSGVFNVQQYANDPRISKPYFCSQQNGDGFGYTGISPADLIATFGTPGSRYYAPRTGPAGFTDAIAGWNFVDDDNDPFDAVHYDHGTGTAEDATASADTVSQEVGTCPNCMILPIKVGDSFITSGNAFAEGALFAVDSGASVIQEALGTFDVTETDTQAITYAEDHGVPVVASAADEESQHHNLPAVLENTIVVNSVTQDSGFEPPSYLFLNGCTNYGANISVSVESNSCSSEATGKTGGIVGLAESAAAVAMAHHVIAPYPGVHTASGAPVPLSANEIAQLVTMSADDIDFATAAPPHGPPNNTKVSTSLPFVTTVRDPTGPGFDPTSGYGRIDAARLVSWIAQGRIPPQAEIDGLPWYQVMNPSQQVNVSGTIGTTRSSSWRYEVQIAPGETPDQSAWRVVAAGKGDGIRTGELATIPLGLVAGLFPESVNLRGSPADADGQPDPDQFMFTIRIVVQDAAGMVGMARRTEFLHEDPTLLHGEPVQLSSSIAAPTVLAPIGPGGTDALLVATAAGSIEALGANGAELPGWPVETAPDTGYHPGEAAYTSGDVTAIPRGEIVGGLAVGDLSDAAGDQMDVVATDLTGRVWAWSSRGRLLKGWPVRTEAAFSAPDVLNPDNEVLRGILGAPALGDLQGKGGLDVVAASMDRHVYAWQPDGKPVPGWPVEVVDPKEVQSVNPADGQVTFLPGAGGDTGSKLDDTPAIAQLVPGGPPQVLVTSNEQYTGYPNASLGILGTLFSLVGNLNDAANSRVYAIWPNGSLHKAAVGAPDPPGYPNPGAYLPGWPVAIGDLDPNLLPDIGDGASNGPAVATVPGKAPLVAVGSDVGPVYVLNSDGTDALGTTSGLPDILDPYPQGAKSNSTGITGISVPSLGAPIIAPLGSASGTGALDVMSAAESAGELLDVSEPAEQEPHDSQIAAWNASTGAFLKGFPQVMDGLQFFDQPIVADLAGSSGEAYAVEASSDSDLRALDASGQEAPGFPKLTGGWVTGGAVFGPLGTLADQIVATGTREGELFIWRTTAPSCGPRGAWPQVHQNLWNTNDYSGTSGDPGGPAAGCDSKPRN
jgi:Subtilase family